MSAVFFFESRFTGRVFHIRFFPVSSVRSTAVLLFNRINVKEYCIEKVSTKHTVSLKAVSHFFIRLDGTAIRITVQTGLFFNWEINADIPFCQLSSRIVKSRLSGQYFYTVTSVLAARTMDEELSFVWQNM